MKRHFSALQNINHLLSLQTSSLFLRKLQRSGISYLNASKAWPLNLRNSTHFISAQDPKRQRKKTENCISGGLVSITCIRTGQLSCFWNEGTKRSWAVGTNKKYFVHRNPPHFNPPQNPGNKDKTLFIFTCDDFSI